MHTEHVDDARRHNTPRVLQVITHLALGGAEEVAISLAEALQSDVAFTFFTVQGGPRDEIGRDFYRRLQACGIPVYSGTMLPMKLGGALAAGFQLRQLIWRLRPDIVQLHTEIPENTFACAALFGLPRGLRVIRTIHNTTLWPAWAQLGAWTERRLTGAEIVGVSQAARDGLHRFQTAHRVPPAPSRRSHVIYAGVHRAGGPAPRVGHPGPPSSLVRVLFAGRLEAQKGVDLLPAIVEQAAALTSRPVELHIAGSGSLEPEIQRWVSAQATPWAVTMGPPIPNLAGALGKGRHDLILMPSRFEGLSLIAVEALLAGVPVIATRIQGPLEVFPDGYPLLAESEDVAGLARILAHAVDDLEPLRAHVASLLPGLRDRFSVEAMGAGYLQLYRQTRAGAPQ